MTGIERDTSTGGQNGPEKPAVEGATPDQERHEGATESEVGDRTGPGAGYDQEPTQEPDKSGVAS